MYDSRSNGVIEKAAVEFIGQLSAVNIGLESRLKEKAKMDRAVVDWMAEHACTLINRCQVGEDGKTPIRRITGREHGQHLVEFGEQFLAKPKRKRRAADKLDLRQHGDAAHGSEVRQGRVCTWSY